MIEKILDIIFQENPEVFVRFVLGKLLPTAPPIRISSCSNVAVSCVSAAKKRGRPKKAVTPPADNA